MEKFGFYPYNQDGSCVHLFAFERYCSILTFNTLNGQKKLLWTDEQKEKIDRRGGFSAKNMAIITDASICYSYIPIMFNSLPSFW